MRALLLTFGLFASASLASEPLRVCADPNNLPYSNERREGFENALAELLGKELGRPVEYTWWAQRRGFVRNTLKEKRCDLWMSMPAGAERVLTTRPYYRSTYVAVSRNGVLTKFESFDDPRLRKLKLGVQLIGDDMWNTPPAHAIAKRGITENVRGYTVYGDFNDDSPALEILRALDRGEIDVAFVWGPLTAALPSGTKWAISPVPIDGAPLPFTFDISVAVRKDAPELKDAIDRVLQKRRKDIDALLRRHHVFRVPPA